MSASDNDDDHNVEELTRRLAVLERRVEEERRGRIRAEVALRESAQAANERDGYALQPIGVCRSILGIGGARQGRVPLRQMRA